MLNHTRLTINGKVRLKNYTKLQLQVSHWMGCAFFLSFDTIVIVVVVINPKEKECVFE